MGDGEAPDRTEDLTGPRARRWRVVAAIEVALAATAVIADLLVPTLVLLAMAGVSLLARRQGLASLGLRRVDHPWSLLGTMLVFAAAWSVFVFGLVIPITSRITGEQQDLSDFSDLEGNLGKLLVLVALSWTLAAVGEELAYRGYVLTRLRDVLGSEVVATVIAVGASSLLFGLAHREQGIVGVVVTTLDAIAFCALRYRHRTVWASVFAHGWSNTIGLITFFLVGTVHGLW